MRMHFAIRTLSSRKGSNFANIFMLLVLPNKPVAEVEAFRVYHPVACKHVS